MTKSKDDSQHFWLYDGRPVTDADVKGFAGFVYCIMDLETGKRYIGKKFTLQKRTPRGKTRKVTSESNWRDYWSSSKELQALVEEKGKDKFKREIVVLGKSRGEVNFAEVLAQMLVGVLESDDWINDAINKWRKAHVSKYTSLAGIRDWALKNP